MNHDGIPTRLLVVGYHFQQIRDILQAMDLNGTGFETQNRQYSVLVLMSSNYNNEKIAFSM